MFRNNKGVTLVALVITILVMLILAGTTLTTSDLVIKDTKKKTLVSNMYVIKAEVEAIYDEYQFSDGNEAVLEGSVVNDLSEYGLTIYDDDLWYSWNKKNLSNLGLDTSMLEGNTEFIVNYATGEVIYSAGCENENGTLEYTLTDIVYAD